MSQPDELHPDFSLDPVRCPECRAWIYPDASDGRCPCVRREALEEDLPAMGRTTSHDGGEW